MKSKTLAAALADFRMEKPWEKIYDVQPFGIRDEETGLWGCASVLGCGGEEFGFSLSFREEGFSIINRLINDEIDKDSFMYELDGLLASFEEPGDVPPETADFYDVFRLPGEGKNTAVVWSKQKGGHAHKLNGKEAEFLTRALRAVIILCRRGDLLPDETVSSDASLPVFTLSGSLPDLNIATSSEIIGRRNKPAAEFKLTKQLAREIMAMPGKSCYLASLWTMPYSVKGKLARAIFIYDAENDRALYVHLMESTETTPYAELFFSALAGREKTAAPPGRPREIETDSLELYNCIGGAAEKLGINLTFVQENLVLNKLRASLIDYIDGGETPKGRQVR